MPRHIDHMIDDWNRFDAEIENQTRRQRGLSGVTVALAAIVTAILVGAALTVAGYMMGGSQRTNAPAAETVIGHQVKMGMSPETIGQLYPSLSMGVPGRGGRTGTFQLDGTLHTVWFATEQGQEQAWRIHFKRAYRDMGEDEVLDLFTAAYGEPKFESCATPVAGYGHECHLRWQAENGVALDVFSQSDLTNRRPLTQIVVVATDTQRATRRFGSQVPPATASVNPPAAAPTAANPLGEAWPAAKPADAAPRAPRPVDQFFNNLKHRR